MENVGKYFSSGGDPNVKKRDGLTLVHQAVRSKNAEMMQLVTKHVNVNTKDFYGQTPMLLACAKGKAEIVQVLIDKKADLKTSGRLGTPLHVACLHGHQQVVQLLLKSNVDVNNRNSGIWRPNSTPLHYACLGGRLDIVRLLLSSGAKADLKDADGKMPSDLAIERGHKEVEAAIKERKR